MIFFFFCRLFLQKCPNIFSYYALLPSWDKQLSVSNATHVTLRSVDFNLNGNVSCEVTTESPFSTATARSALQVVGECKNILLSFSPCLFQLARILLLCRRWCDEKRQEVAKEQSSDGKCFCFAAAWSSAIERERERRWQTFNELFIEFSHTFNFPNLLRPCWELMRVFFAFLCDDKSRSWLDERSQHVRAFNASLTHPCKARGNSFHSYATITTTTSSCEPKKVFLFRSATRKEACHCCVYLVEAARGVERVKTLPSTSLLNEVKGSSFTFSSHSSSEPFFLCYIHARSESCHNEQLFLPLLFTSRHSKNVWINYFNWRPRELEKNLSSFIAVTTNSSSNYVFFAAAVATSSLIYSIFLSLLFSFSMKCKWCCFLTEKLVFVIIVCVCSEYIFSI